VIKVTAKRSAAPTRLARQLRHAPRRHQPGRRAEAVFERPAQGRSPPGLGVARPDLAVVAGVAMQAGQPEGPGTFLIR
jgi:hypothetical protein